MVPGIRPIFTPGDVALIVPLVTAVALGLYRIGEKS
ncbi:hypothetical protein BH24CHL10_BH24CHL10_01520 [soil metagenome]